ncbi:RagB/SusD family nutrient uptake outer membrane protein [Pseudotamlana carrageenivorans]|uniref:RagB/SusD family nutrient uptake outer membrane protein n=1 Tax=Pseudotamlana carrageenivorans TaxID=2069432 RepID=A0A2I7SEP1_9FLAO|nr:RagB/SusD family nutrient uptake outer membrane protein [Tamlana carrageenivorans]AUS04357.1 RagB/SusD family nutrient uptake outer membrane protein [Tamlana carrageenivorans]
MKIRYIYILCLGVLSLGSCDIETEPLTQLTDTNFYTTTDDAFTALVGCYDGLQVATGASGVGLPVATEIFSDDCFGGTGNADAYNYAALDEFDITRAPSFVDIFNDNWVAYYKAIYRCNVLLSKMDQINWEGNDTLRMTIESETKFIRAYVYFEMVRLWGNIPLLTEPSTENIPQADPADVYQVIAEDLLFASNNLTTGTYNTVDAGRVTKWAAKSLLARVFLYYTGYYGTSDLVGVVSKQEVLAHLEDVIASSGHGLVDDFASLWPVSAAAAGINYAGEDNEEIVFSIRYTYTSDYNGNTDGNHWLVLFGMREYSYVPYGNGWGVTVNSKLWDAYSDTDMRKTATVISVDDEGVPFDKIDNQREYTGYYNKKYTPMSILDEDGNPISSVNEYGVTDFQINQYQDYVVLRYADVLLMAVELGSSNAQAYYDEVRQRAYKSNFVSKTVSQDNILEERHLEFALEGVRYYDLLRQGVNTAASTIAETTTLLSGGVAETKTISASNIQATSGLQQIPNTQITLSGGVLKQNAGW